MSASQSLPSQSNPATKLLTWIADVGINGLGVLHSAEKVAQNHLKSAGNVEDAIKSIIRWRTTHGAATGFVTGLGGIAALPVALPAGMAAAYASGANTAAAIACLRGYDIHSDQIRTMVLCCLLGEGVEQVLKTTGIQVGNKMAQNLIKQVPGKVLIEINKKVGFRLITKAGEKGVVNLMKIVPVVGGVVGGAFDATFVNTCGKTAKRFFSKIDYSSLK